MTDQLLVGAVHLLNSRQPFFELYGAFLEGTTDVRSGNHLRNQLEHVSPAGSFRLASNVPIESKYVPTRDSQRIDSAAIGILETENAALQVCRTFLALRREAGVNLTDAIYRQVFLPMQGRYLAAVSQICPQSRFVVLSRGVPFSAVIAKSSSHMIFLWTNEDRPEDRLHATYKDDFAYYRLPVFLDGCLVFKTTFLCQKLRQWNNEFKSDLKLCAAFENALMKSWRPIL